jgi:hypothetical protein
MGTGSNGAAPNISHPNCRYSEKSFVICGPFVSLLAHYVPASSIWRPVRRDS